MVLLPRKSGHRASWVQGNSVVISEALKPLEDPPKAALSASSVPLHVHAGVFEDPRCSRGPAEPGALGGKRTRGLFLFHLPREALGPETPHTGRSPRSLVRGFSFSPPSHVSTAGCMLRLLSPRLHLLIPPFASWAKNTKTQEKEKQLHGCGAAARCGAERGYSVFWCGGPPSGLPTETGRPKSRVHVNAWEPPKTPHVPQITAWRHSTGTVVPGGQAWGRIPRASVVRLHPADGCASTRNASLLFPGCTRHGSGCWCPRNSLPTRRGCLTCKDLTDSREKAASSTADWLLLASERGCKLLSDSRVATPGQSPSPPWCTEELLSFPYCRGQLSTLCAREPTRWPLRAQRTAWCPSPARPHPEDGGAVPAECGGAPG